MIDAFGDMLAVGGKLNSLGRVNDVVELVLHDKNKLDELYGCVFNEDAWIRMRAMDALEKICRQHPDWLSPYINKFQVELSLNSQPSIQWHLAQIYSQVSLNPKQKLFAINWLKELLDNTDIDWIVAANALQTLVYFTTENSFPKADMISLLKVQQEHKSKSVVKKVNKLLSELLN